MECNYTLKIFLLPFYQYFLQAIKLFYHEELSLPQYFSVSFVGNNNLVTSCLNVFLIFIEGKYLGDTLVSFGHRDEAQTFNVYINNLHPKIQFT